MSQVVAIHGLGLMGASLGLALRQAGDFTVHGYARRAETRDAALAGGVVDVAFDDPSAAAADADIIVLCTPILSIPDLLSEISGALKSGAIVTDVGSTKAWLESACPPQLVNSDARFVGSHPMCGSEKTGLEAGCAELYRDRTVVVCGDCPALTSLWESVGAQVLQLDPATHDELVANTSHLPHLSAALLVLAARREPLPHFTQLAATGYRDSTRVAAGSPDVWHDIVKTNAGPVVEGLKALRRETDAMLEQLDAGDFDGLRDALARAAELR